MSTEQIIELINILKKYYPDAKCSLNFTTPFELLIAVMLSAQCTDERVNKVTPLLFSKYNKPHDFINLDVSDIESIIHPCGFYKNKAKNIKNMSIMLVEKYNGIVPNTIEELIKLPGIGRKSTKNRRRSYKNNSTRIF
jgi:endonuclease-3